jgi:hypothetical protein
MFPPRHEDGFVNLNLLYIYPKEDDKYLYECVFILWIYKKIKYKIKYKIFIYQ